MLSTIQKVIPSKRNVFIFISVIISIVVVFVIFVILYLSISKKSIYELYGEIDTFWFKYRNGFDELLNENKSQESTLIGNAKHEFAKQMEYYAEYGYSTDEDKKYTLARYNEYIEKTKNDPKKYWLSKDKQFTKKDQDDYLENLKKDKHTAEFIIVLEDQKERLEKGGGSSTDIKNITDAIIKLKQGNIFDNLGNGYDDMKEWIADTDIVGYDIYGNVHRNKKDRDYMSESIKERSERMDEYDKETKGWRKDLRKYMKIWDHKFSKLYNSRSSMI